MNNILKEKRNILLDDNIQWEYLTTEKQNNLSARWWCIAILGVVKAIFKKMKIFATAHFWRTSPRRKNNLLHGHIQWAYFDNKKQNFLFATWCCNATLLTRKGIFLKMKTFATAHFWRTSPRRKNNLLHHHIQWAYFDKRKQNFQDVGTKTFFCNRKIEANWIFFLKKEWVTTFANSILPKGDLK